MTNPLVTLGVPVYRGQDRLPALLECLKTQSYKEIDVLISVDGADQSSAEACQPFLQQDSRFRMQVQPSRLGWAGNTDWTMRNRRGDFYIYQQHDDLLSPTYVADLVDASVRWPEAVIFFSRVQFTERLDVESSAPSLLGDRKARAMEYLRRLDWIPFRGLIRGSALDKTSGLLLSDFDPFDSLGTEWRFMAELSLLGEFRFVEGPTYFKSAHAENLADKRLGWPREHWITAMACWAAWMIEVIAPAGTTVRERRRLLKITIERFTGRPDRLKWIRPVWRNESRTLAPIRMIRNQLKKSERLLTAVRRLEPVTPHWSSMRDLAAEERSAFLRQVVDRLKRGGRFDPYDCMDTTWEALESAMVGHHKQKW